MSAPRTWKFMSLSSLKGWKNTQGSAWECVEAWQDEKRRKGGTDPLMYILMYLLQQPPLIILLLKNLFSSFFFLSLWTSVVPENNDHPLSLLSFFYFLFFFSLSLLSCRLRGERKMRRRERKRKAVIRTQRMNGIIDSVLELCLLSFYSQDDGRMTLNFPFCFCSLTKKLSASGPDARKVGKILSKTSSCWSASVVLWKLMPPSFLPFSLVFMASLGSPLPRIKQRRQQKRATRKESFLDSICRRLWTIDTWQGH